MDKIGDVFSVPSDPMRIRRFWHLQQLVDGMAYLVSFDNLDPTHVPVSRKIRRDLCLNVSRPLGESAGASDAAREDVLGE